MPNPLFPTNDEDAKVKPPVDGPATAKVPEKAAETTSLSNNAAVNLIRQKLKTIYSEEPNATQELQQAENIVTPLSKHQQYITQLQGSGKSLAEIQMAWHRYYVNLPDGEKFEVWQEFYTSHQMLHQGQLTPKSLTPTAPAASLRRQSAGSASAVVASHQPPPIIRDKRTVADTRKTILATIQNQVNLKPRDHLKSLAFGLVCGAVVIAVFLFSFFNEVIIAPFIQPSRNVGSIPLIITASTVSTSGPEVIIPKINVEIPVDYSETSTNENSIENDLEGGVVHYPDTVLPGQNGNAAFFGHSSNNIFNPGQYKFAFVLLHTLVDGDTFYLTYNNQIFAYEVVDHKVVPPSDVSVLNDSEGHQATAALITCDPPGTSINRLVVLGVQISPSPSSNTAAPSSPQLAAEPTSLPGNGPSLWNRFTSWLF
ncbi:MAG TPA: sortase [Candidatus Binatia bacterium]|nr:sortase [Candidatus Binatia bacterium]